MATWYGLVNPANGDLISVGSAAMFDGGVVVDPYLGYSVITFGADAPDFAAKVWNTVTRLMVDRPAPILISRLDDIDAWLLADTDFALMWGAINATRRTQLRAGWRRVMAKVLGGQVWRGESESVEI